MRNNEDLLARGGGGGAQLASFWTQGSPGLKVVTTKGKLSKRVWGINSAFLGTQGRKN